MSSKHYFNFNCIYIGTPQGFLGSGENGFLFSGSWGSTGNYFRGAREQAHNFGDLGSLAKKQKNKEKPHFCMILFKFLLLLGD